ncbi:MAG: diaminopimelate epimerase, partial [Telluria sp.]
MKLKFTKMHGAGNDFIVIDAIHQQVDLSPAQWKRLGDRRFGIGADQILVVQRADSADCDFRYRIFNQDGGEVEQCGNGSRAFVKFVTEKGLTAKSAIRVQTMKGIITPRIAPDGTISVDMGAPRLLPADLPFDAAGLVAHSQHDDALYTLALPDGTSVTVSLVSMGNPHAVQLVDDADQAPVAVIGPLVEQHV